MSASALGNKEAMEGCTLVLFALGWHTVWLGDCTPLRLRLGVEDESPSSSASSNVPSEVSGSSNEFEVSTLAMITGSSEVEGGTWGGREREEGRKRAGF